MKKSAYGKPIFINNGTSQTVNRIEALDEQTIQNIIFNFPSCIPISDIDESYNPVIPICKELRTPIGFIDVLMITPNGDIVIIETKLWRNPEARRSVIGQILDYANELSKWTYEDIQRELNRRFQGNGNFLYEMVKKEYPDLALNEVDFVDAVTRNLNRGKFLLLIIGDGIREGAAGIADFISNAGHLNFALAMIELNIYEINQFSKIVVPRTIVKTIEVQKINIELINGMVISNSNNDTSRVISKEDNISPELQEKRLFYNSFWKELISELKLDDPGQVLPNASFTQNLYIYPGKNKYAWISAYFSQSSKRVGVYFKCQNDQNGERIAEGLGVFKEDIRMELGQEVRWSWENDPKDPFSIRMQIDDVYNFENREKIKSFFIKWINQFVNVLRPRLKEFQ